MATIGASDYLGMPVSTTHVLSSGIAGTMAANHSGLQMNTLRNLLLVWPGPGQRHVHRNHEPAKERQTRIRGLF